MLSNPDLSATIVISQEKLLSAVWSVAAGGQAGQQSNQQLSLSIAPVLCSGPAFFVSNYFIQCGNYA
jgi:hypothetical protein